MKLVHKILGPFLVLASICLNILSLGLNNWATTNSDKELGLYSCKNCGKFKENWNYESLAKSYCSVGFQSECELYTDLYKASFGYLILEFASLLMSLLLLEKICGVCFKWCVGMKPNSAIFAGLMLIFHVFGTIVWFGYTGAGGKCPKNKLTERAEICIGPGSGIALSNIFVMTTAFCYFLFAYLRTEWTEITEIQKPKLFWISGKWWAGLSLIFAGCYFVFALSALTVDNWISSNEFRGSLFRCENCENLEHVPWLSWSSLKTQNCEIDSQSFLCGQFSKVSRASDIYIILQAACLILFAFFLQNLASVIRNFIYGNRMFNYLTPWVLALTNLASVIAWFKITDVSGTCSKTNTCVSTGPQLSIVSNIFIFPSVFIYTLLVLKSQSLIITKTIDLKHYNSIVIEKSAIGSLEDTRFLKQLT